MRATEGHDPSLVGSMSLKPGQGIAGWVAESGETVALADGPAHPRYMQPPVGLLPALRAYLCAPLRVHEEIVGVTVARRTVVEEFSEDEITVFQTICKQVAIVIEKTRLDEARVEAEKLAAVAVSLSGVAHYIKNILVAVRGGEYLIEAGIERGDLEQTAQGWKALRRSIRKIGELVENMLNYYRREEIHPRPIDLNSLVMRVLGDLEERAMDRDTLLTPDVDLRLERVEFDPDVLTDVLINLITNAIDAIPEGRKGLVRVQTRLLEDEGQVRLVVSDNGAGVAPEHRAKIFNLFFTTKGKGGTGIGLAATRKLILDHGGEIEMETEVGRGTDMIARLPLRQTRA
jgi:signal transduction histidine kinase